MNLLDRFLQHNRWATQRLLEYCRSLSTEQFHERFDIGPGSLHDTLQHIIGAMRRWADRVGGREVRPSIEQEQKNRSVDELMKLLEDAATDLESVTCAVSRENRFDEMMEIRIPRYENPFRFTRGTAIVHVLTHGTHHRAQCLNMLRRVGIQPDDLPDIDAIEWELIVDGHD